MAERLTEQFGSLNLTESATATKKLRIATWNVDKLTTVSEEKRKIIRDVAEAIKRNEFDIVALQEVSSKDALQYLCLALNENGTNNQWCYANRQHDLLKLGFVWKCGIGHEVHDLQVDFQWKPYHLKFKFEGSTINLVNLHLIQRGNRPKESNEISRKILNDKEQDKLIDLVHNVCPTDQRGTYAFLIGDFNCFPWSKGLQDNKYVNVFPLRKYTNKKQDECYDNIIVPDTTLYDNVTVVPIQDCSDHFPIYADFYFPTA